MKKILGAALALSLLLIGCGGKKEEPVKKQETKTYTLKVGTSQGEKHPIYRGIEKMKDEVAKRTDGKLVIEGYPSGQLGGDEDIMEQAKLGTNVALVVDGGKLSEYKRELGVVGIAYAADNYEQMKKMVETPSFKEWSKGLEDHDLSIVSFNWFQGTRNFYTNKKIEKPEDLSGVLIRTPGAAVWSESIKALGATPVALPWNEVYPAMQQKVIDGFEAQTSSVAASSLQETIKFMTRTGHFQLMTGVVVGKKFMDSLPEEYKTILLEEAHKAGEYASNLDITEAAEFEKRMKDEFNVEISEVDITPFKNRALEVFKKLGYEKEYNQLKSEIK